MPKTIHNWVIIVFALIGCGPHTIFVRPGLDTPAQHVTNGYQLLELEKWDDACREFQRARDLDPNCTEAFVGLAVAYGGKGDLDHGFELLGQARRMAITQAERDKIQQANERLHLMNNVR